ncbi:MAG: RNA polymerase sigma factor [Bryobacteraceae bacterium]
MYIRKCCPRTVVDKAIRAVVYSLFLRITRDQSVAEDLVQELFIRVWNDIHSFDPSKGALGVWILSVGRNMAIDYVRSVHARFSARLESMEHADRADRGHHNEPEIIIDQARTVAAAFESLNLKQRHVR